MKHYRATSDSICARFCRSFSPSSSFAFSLHRKEFWARTIVLTYSRICSTSWSFCFSTWLTIFSFNFRFSFNFSFRCASLANFSSVAFLVSSCKERTQKYGSMEVVCLVFLTLAMSLEGLLPDDALLRRSINTQNNRQHTTSFYPYNSVSSFRKR
jgi:hypothetical protein